MKLNKKLKDKIDSYFKMVSLDDLYSMLIQKYDFVDENDILVQKKHNRCQEEK
jgi:hypothetical protein